MSHFVALMYHGISDAEQRSQYVLSWNDFRQQLKWLEEARIQAAGFKELEELGQAEISPPEVVVTFDDGHSSNLEAATELAQRGMRSIVFVTPKFCIEQSDFLKPADLRALHRVADVGTHGFSHRALTKLDQLALRSEVVESKRWLEDILGAEVRYMSAPGGFINEHVTEVCLTAGYHLIGNSVEWWNQAPHAGLRTVNRVALRRGWPIETFRAIVRRHLSFYVRRRMRSATLALPKLVLNDAVITRLNKLRGAA